MSPFINVLIMCWQCESCVSLESVVQWKALEIESDVTVVNRICSVTLYQYFDGAMFVI